MDYTDYCISNMSSAAISLPEETSNFRPIYRGASTAFCIQLFCIDEKHEARQVLVPSASAAQRPSPGLGGPTLESCRARGFQAWLHLLISGGVFKNHRFLSPTSRLQPIKFGSDPQNWAAQGLENHPFLSHMLFPIL